jgi:hypothetical protein
MEILRLTRAGVAMRQQPLLTAGPEGGLEVIPLPLAGESEAPER